MILLVYLAVFTLAVVLMISMDGWIDPVWGQRALVRLVTAWNPIGLRVESRPPYPVVAADRVLLLVNHIGLLDWLVLLVWTRTHYPEHHTAFVYDRAQVAALPGIARALLERLHIPVDPGRAAANLLRLHTSATDLGGRSTRWVIVLFCEGMIRSSANATSWAECRHVLRPRVGGCYHLLRTRQVEAVVDLTLSYPGGQPTGRTWWEMLAREAYPRAAVVRARDVTDDAPAEPALETTRMFLERVWMDKEAALGETDQRWWSPDPPPAAVFPVLLLLRLLPSGVPRWPLVPWAMHDAALPLAAEVVTLVALGRPTAAIAAHATLSLWFGHGSKLTRAAYLWCAAGGGGKKV